MSASERGPKPGSMADVAHRTANRRTALTVAAKAVSDTYDGEVSPRTDPESWARRVIARADLLLPWLNADLPTPPSPEVTE